VSGPDPRFASLSLEQFGGGNGELKVAMQHFVQSFGVHEACLRQYDLLMDIATEEFSHPETEAAERVLAAVDGGTLTAGLQSSLPRQRIYRPSR
jgi:Mn-containing catalase